jgi:hypothetical protein
MKRTQIAEPARTIPVLREVDVLVAGGGTAGMIAGLAAARAGASTLVLERLNCLGGNFTAGLMTTTWTMNDQKKLIVKGIPLELIERLEEDGGTIKGDKSKDTFVNYDTELAKFIITELYAAEKNLEILYYAWVCDTIVEDNTVKGVIIETKSGRRAILAKTVVDATGDADVAARGGAEYRMAPRNELHPVSLLAKIANVNVEELNAYYKQHPDQIGDFLRGSPYTGFHSFRLNKELAGIPLPDELEYLRDWFILYYSTPRKGDFILNMTGETGIDGTNAEEVSRAELVSRKRLSQALEVFKKHMPGFQDAYFTTTAQTLGVRETRRILGSLVLNRENVLANSKYEDAVCSYHAPVAIHTADGKNIDFEDLKPGTSYDIPLRCLVPKSLDGILVTGRSISVEANIIGTIRNMTSCLALGQGAGVAAALASAKGIAPRAIKNEDLQDALLGQGVYLEGRSNLENRR